MSIAEFKLSSLVRIIRALVFVLVFAEAATAQSTLNFVHGFEDGKSIAIANTSSTFADVQFTFYKLDGSLPVGSLPLNPVSYPIPPRGRIAMIPADIFGGVPPAGWIQATSTTTGLSAESTDALIDQIIPLFSKYPVPQISLTNAGAQAAVALVKFYDASGREVTAPNGSSRRIEAHSRTDVSIPGGSISARVASNFPIIATTTASFAGPPVFISGQSTNQVTATRMVPIFKNGSGATNTLALTNPDDAAIAVSVSFVDGAGNAKPISSFNILGNGSYTSPPLSQIAATGGYLRIDSDSLTLAGLLIRSSGNTASVIPLQSNPSDRILFGGTSNAATISLFSPSSEQTQIEVSYVNADGTTVSQNSMSLTGTRTISVREIASSTENGFIAIRSSGAKLYAFETLGGPQSTVVTSQFVDPAFIANPVVAVPSWVGAIQRNGSGVIHSGDSVTGLARSLVGDPSVTCGGKAVDNLEAVPDPNSAGAFTLRFLMPQIDPGFVNCRIRSEGIESNAVRVAVMDAANTLTGRLPGQAFYQKLEITDIGLDTDKVSYKPIRNARVEVLDLASRLVISASDTDNNGKFLVAVPPDATGLSIHVVSRLRTVDLKVEDNTNANQFYFAWSSDVDMREPPANVQLVDRSRRSGAFNILEQIQRANDFVHAADPQFVPFPFTIFWSERNQNKFGSVKDGLVGTTFFSLTTSTAYILGDRNTDSDEYDDSVLLHEYAHMLAAKFSRDDSIGGAHHSGDNLDPRVAWSEGWANFFSAAVRGNSIYRDSSGPGGASVMRLDLDENYPPGSWTGYGSETSVQALLWDFFDDKSEYGDTAQFSFSQIWTAFTDLKNYRFVYLPYFLDNLLARNPAASDSMQRMVQAQAIDFQPGVIPSVTNPFPSVIAMNSSRFGELDSLTSRRTNLAKSSNFFVFATNGGPVSIQLAVAPATVNNPNANDLDLYLFDVNGRQIGKSVDGRNGQSEAMTTTSLPPGSYVIEVRSYFTNAKGTTIYNSGKYNLSLSH